mmetsp:Transcript_29579/g.67826  ORF Transcript_29579/g.67826 Transcript_29579/m.67826 type:complete len:149 (-) Transcript_29579:157-603(-)
MCVCVCVNFALQEVLQTSKDVQLHHLLKFLVLKLNLKESSWMHFRLSLRPTTAVRVEARTVQLMVDTTLGHIVKNYLTNPRQLVLEYRLASSHSYADVKRDTPHEPPPVPPVVSTAPLRSNEAGPQLVGQAGVAPGEPGGGDSVDIFG